jgi:hypothetical protein
MFNTYRSDFYVVNELLVVRVDNRISIHRGERPVELALVNVGNRDAMITTAKMTHWNTKLRAWTSTDLINPSPLPVLVPAGTVGTLRFELPTVNLFPPIQPNQWQTIGVEIYALDSDARTHIMNLPLNELAMGEVDKTTWMNKPVPFPPRVDLLAAPDKFR